MADANIQQADARARTGWAAVGVVVDFSAMREVRVKNIAGIAGEIGDEMSALYRDGVMDSWHILFGNSETEVYDVTKLIHGLIMYHKVKLSTDLQLIYGVEPTQLNPSSVPPGMRKRLVAGHPSAKSSKLHRLSATPNVVDLAAGKSNDADKRGYSGWSTSLIPTPGGHFSGNHIQTIVPPVLISNGHQSRSESAESANFRGGANSDSQVCSICDRLYSLSKSNGTKQHSLNGYAYCVRCSAAVAAVTPKEHSSAAIPVIVKNALESQHQVLEGSTEPSTVHTYPILKR